MTAGNMPGGGAAKSMKAKGTCEEKNWINMKWQPAKASPKKPVDKLYTTSTSAEKGKVDAAKVASLMAKPNRPKPLKRKSTNKLEKAAKKTLIASRNEASKKYAERSAEIKKELLYKKNALKRQNAYEKALKKKQPKGEPECPNILSLIYSVGPQPKYKAISKKFREFRKFSKTQLMHSKSKSDEISFIYKVGTPVAAK